MFNQWFLTGIFCYIVRGLYTNSLTGCSKFIIHQHLSRQCTCFFFKPEEITQTMLRLIDESVALGGVFMVSPAEEMWPLETNQLEPVKPYPCSYVIDLPSIGSNITWSLIRGSYEQGEYFLNESKYLVVSTVEHNEEEILTVLDELFHYGFIDVNFVNPEDSKVSIYTAFPFGQDFKSCPEDGLDLQIVDEWINGTLQNKSVLYPNKLPAWKFNGCAFNVSSPFYPPFVLVPPNDTIIRGRLRGFEAAPISTALLAMNLTPVLRVHFSTLWSTILENGTVLGSIPDVTLSGRSQITIGAFTATWAITIDATMFYSWKAVTWFVAAPNRYPKWKMLINAIDPDLWVFILAAELVVSTVYWIMTKFSNVNSSFVKVLILMTSLKFSNSTQLPPVSNVLRIVYFSWLYYCFIIDQTYLASLTGLITSSDYEPLVGNIDQLVNLNIPTYAYMTNYQAMMANSTRPKIGILAKNYLPINGIVWNTLNEISKYKNASIADSVIFLSYCVSARPNISIYSTSVQLEDTTLHARMWRHNYLFDRFNWVLCRMYDAGFPVFYLRGTVADKFWTPSNEQTARPLVLGDVISPLYALGLGLTLSSLVFLVELLLGIKHKKPTIRKNLDFVN